MRNDIAILDGLTAMAPMRLTSLIAAAILAGGLGAAEAAGPEPRIASDAVDWRAEPVRLMMIEQDGCVYCAAWDREIGPGYATSRQGRAAPLLVVDIDGPWPDGLVLDRRPTLTPTFILLRGGDELSRLEGYPGDRYFYSLIDDMLRKAGIGVKAKEAEG